MNERTKRRSPAARALQAAGTGAICHCFCCAVTLEITETNLESRLHGMEEARPPGPDAGQERGRARGGGGTVGLASARAGPWRLQDRTTAPRLWAPVSPPPKGVQEDLPRWAHEDCGGVTPQGWVQGVPAAGSFCLRPWPRPVLLLGELWSPRH